jgi:hypothetical protein
VRRDVRRHADGDPRRAVDQQIRDARRKDDRLGLGAVVVRSERDRRLIDFREELVRQPGQAALGVAHRGRAVAVERSEIAGAVDEGIAQRKRLRHPNERFVEGQVAVGVIAPHDVADDLRALAVLHVGGQILLPHREQDAALDGLQPVADVRQGPGRDDRERVIEISGLRGFVERDVLVSGTLRGFEFIRAVEK